MMLQIEPNISHTSFVSCGWEHSITWYCNKIVAILAHWKVSISNDHNCLEFFVELLLTMYHTILWITFHEFLNALEYIKHLFLIWSWLLIKNFFKNLLILTMTISIATSQSCKLLFKIFMKAKKASVWSISN